MSVNAEANQFVSRPGADSAEVADVRHRFSDWMLQADIPDDDASELAIAFSELVTNAAEASRGADDPVVSRAWIDDEEVILEVANTVAAADGPDASRWDLDDPLRSGGRGLLIVQAYTDDLEIDVSGRTLIVRCRRHLGD